MLVLSRKLHETILIGDNIKLTITSIKGDQVRIGISAPPDVQIHREEVARRIREWADPAHVVQGRHEKEVPA
jgi:carbon storage regulator